MAAPGTATYIDGKPVMLCGWFAKCDSPAYMAAPHPALGHVPICTGCAAKMGINPGDLSAIEVTEATA